MYHLEIIGYVRGDIRSYHLPNQASLVHIQQRPFTFQSLWTIFIIVATALGLLKLFLGRVTHLFQVEHNMHAYIQLFLSRYVNVSITDITPFILKQTCHKDQVIFGFIVYPILGVVIYLNSIISLLVITQWVRILVYHIQ